MLLFKSMSGNDFGLTFLDDVNIYKSYDI